MKLLDKAVTFDAFNVFPRHYFKCFPFPNQQHCSVLIDLAIRCNWPSITFHSKLIFAKCIPNQRRQCCLPKQRQEGAGPLKKNSGTKPEPGMTAWVVPERRASCGQVHSPRVEPRGWRAAASPSAGRQPSSPQWGLIAGPKFTPDKNILAKLRQDSTFSLKVLKYIYFLRLTLSLHIPCTSVISKFWEIH